ncbi:phosphoglyceromutase [Babesia ovata]|uniref:phosphoglycerate mutase (2,3-diphosphoglycerate-dependent) n=1 Tax=Babesia ovata TaxID=189622 RepID=A0A2H6K6Z6_9APIC|nr:phosphoglyceromutase [Babesia ovata]GBE58777.1 phosphoglyceromutase [Babesia ovata]
MYTVVFVRHGESEWNLANRFCGWADKALTETGKNEARECGKILKEANFKFGTLFTSVLKRAIVTADIIMEVLGHSDIPTYRNWRLNERHYGALQGLNKAETVEKFSLEKVNIWRRSYNTPPPACSLDSEFYPGNDPMYDCIPRDEIPNGESLELCQKRVLPYWNETIIPQMKAGEPVLVVAHGNTIRALMKVIENITDEEITKINIPHGVPIVYNFSCDMKFMDKKFLMSEEELKAKMAEIANQVLKK